MKYVLDVHTHTIASGHAYNTIKEMAQSASEKGLELLGITEHAMKMPGTCHSFYFANLKMLYVMENNGLSFQDSSEKGADAYLKYSAGNTLKNGIYSSDGFLYLLICRLREVQPDYWNSLQAVFSNAHDSFNETEISGIGYSGRRFLFRNP